MKMCSAGSALIGIPVTPFTGVWIEIGTPQPEGTLVRWSHPSRVCGLKWVARIGSGFGR